MKQLQKSDLKEGEIYVARRNTDSSKYIVKINNNMNGCFNIYGYINILYRHGNFSSVKLNYFEATPEEKHWLETCIKADQFVSYEEAMKTFIPEYVECIIIDSLIEVGKIYKTTSLKDWPFPSNNGCTKVYTLEIGNDNPYYTSQFKPSTKEAYDAQFVVKEPEFVLPEKWAIIITNENKDIVNNYRKSIFNNANIYCNLDVNNVHLSDRYDGTYYHSNKYYFKERTNCEEITTEQFKQYVLKENTTIIEEPKVVLEEPKDKVLAHLIQSGKTTIQSVECSEGGVYRIGDKITVFDKYSPNKGKVFTIKGFRWSNDKSKICAVTELHTPNGIGLDKIELYVEPKVKVKDDFVLPEKWCVKVNEELRNRFGYYEAYGYHHSIQINDTNKWSINIKEGFTEITFEQFKKYVLKDE